jgi:hypothetical protein
MMELATTALSGDVLHKTPEEYLETPEVKKSAKK